MDKYINYQVMDRLCRLKGQETVKGNAGCGDLLLFVIGFSDKGSSEQVPQERRECAIQPLRGQTFRAEGEVRGRALRWCISFLGILERTKSQVAFNSRNLFSHSSGG